MSAVDGNCVLCREIESEIVWEDALAAVVLAGGAEGEAFPGFCRVIWKAHVAEMSDLPIQHREHIMKIVFLTELAVRSLVAPDKINLASLGNVAPHLHWHVIPRWHDDSHYPAPIWAAARRAVSRRPRPGRDAMRTAFEAAWVAFFGPDTTETAR